MQMRVVHRHCNDRSKSRNTYETRRHAKYPNSNGANRLEEAYNSCSLNLQLSIPILIVIILNISRYICLLEKRLANPIYPACRVYPAKQPKSARFSKFEKKTIFIEPSETVFSRRSKQSPRQRFAGNCNTRDISYMHIESTKRYQQISIDI